MPHCGNISLKIWFSPPLEEGEEHRFWGSLVGELEQLGLQAGGGSDARQLDWVIESKEGDFDCEAVIQRLWMLIPKIEKKVARLSIEILS